MRRAGLQRGPNQLPTGHVLSCRPAFPSLCHADLLRAGLAGRLPVAAWPARGRAAGQRSGARRGDTGRGGKSGSARWRQCPASGLASGASSPAGRTLYRHDGTSGAPSACHAGQHPRRGAAAGAAYHRADTGAGVHDGGKAPSPSSEGASPPGGRTAQGTGRGLSGWPGGGAGAQGGCGLRRDVPSGVRAAVEGTAQRAAPEGSAGVSVGKGQCFPTQAARRSARKFRRAGKPGQGGAGAYLSAGCRKR